MLSVAVSAGLEQLRASRVIPAHIRTTTILNACLVEVYNLISAISLL